MLQYTILIFFILTTSVSFAQETCNLDEPEKSPLKKFDENVRKLLGDVEGKIGDSSCGNDSIAAWNLVTGMQELMGSSLNLGVNHSDSRYYFDASSMMLAFQSSDHEDILVALEEEILNISAKVFVACAENENMGKSGKVGSGYDPSGKILLVVLKDILTQSKRVFLWYRNIMTNVSDREFIDVQVSMAPKEFTNDMREFYSAINYQKCLDDYDKTKVITEKITNSAKNIFNFKLDFDLYRNAFQELLYGKNNLSANKDHERWGKKWAEEEERKAKADRFWLTNSKKLYNVDYFSEKSQHWVLAQDVAEFLFWFARRYAAQLSGNLWLRRVIQDVEEDAKEKEKELKPVDLKNEENRANRLEEIHKNLYDDYAERSVLMLQDMAQDPIISVWLVRAIEQLELMYPHLQRIADKICVMYDRQATNAPKRPTCKELFKIEDDESSSEEENDDEQEGEENEGDEANENGKEKDDGQGQKNNQGWESPDQSTQSQFQRPSQAEIPEGFRILPWSNPPKGPSTINTFSNYQ